MQGLLFGNPDRSGETGRAIVKTATSKPTAVYSLSGRLYKSEGGWILLSVPNAMVRGAFDALDEQGIELPPSKGDQFNAHISVMRSEELDEIGGANKITERGHTFTYQLGRVKTVSPAGWKEMSKVWMIEIKSPELEKLRKSYGLSARPHNNEFAFHITIAVRRKKVLQVGEVSKAAFHLPWMKTSKVHPFRPVNADPDFIQANQEWHDVEKARLKEAKKHQQPAGYIKETEKIKKNRVGKGAKSHKFQAAAWTHPNGHPRCKICGDEETLDGQCEGYKAASVLVKMALSSMSIPDRTQQGDLGKIRTGQLLDLIVQRHQTQRAGTHEDVRIGSPELGLYSWATHKGLPEPGGRHPAFRQPLHSYAYGDFQGAIARGPGAGTVQQSRKEKIKITGASPDKISFTAKGEQFELFRVGKGWRIVNVTQTPLHKTAFWFWQKHKKEAAAPYWQRAGLAQFYSPEWSSSRGLLGNIVTNLMQARQRGQRMVASQDTAKDMISAQSTQAALSRMQNFLSQGDHVTNPMDQLLFRPLPRF